MKKSPRKLLVVAVSLIMLFVAACSSNSGNNAADGNKGAGNNTGNKQQEEKAPEEVTIRFSTWDEGHEELVKKFEEQNPGIKVDYEKVAGDYNTKLITQLAAGNAPDVYEVGNPTVYAETNAAEPLESYMEQDKFNKSDYYATVLQMGDYKGKTYALTKDYSNYVIFYNKKLFDEAKIPYPQDGWTWDDFRDTARKLTKKEGDKTVLWGASVGDTWDMPFESIVQQAGGEVSNPEGTKTAGYLDSEKTQNALEYFLSFFSEGLSPSPTQRAAMKGVDLFASNKVAMTMTGKWFLTNWKETPDLEFGAVGLPKNEKNANFIAWAGFSMNAASKHKDAAWKLLKFIGGYEGSMAYGQYALPAMPKAAEDLGMAQDPVVGVFFKELEHVQQLSFQRYAYWGELGGPAISKMLEKALAEASKGTVSREQIKSMLTETSKEIDKEISKKQAE